MRRSIALFAFLVIVLMACGSDGNDSAEEPTPTATSTEEAPEPATTPEPVDQTPAGEDPDEQEPTPAPIEEPTPTPVEEPTPIPEATPEPLERPEPIDLSQPAFGSSSKLSTVGLGGLYFGMTPQSAAEAVSTQWTGDQEGACYLVAPANGPSGVVFTVHNNTIERVDITNATITTRSGAGVGKTEAELDELFGARLLKTPYPDGNGNSIQYVPVDEADAEYRVIFETNGTTVTSMRAGRLPTVAPVEPCT
ncbi:hypothetical protein [Candidatus Poriferisocius sp.]|uniref:hypothetical protein n=1 Tax=Candidatus Poriferisocius sp. TaxID=3101276 RepID=UPI003B022641